MSQNIVLKRSSLSGKVPDTGSLNLGEIAINTYDGKVFLKRSGSIESIQEIITTNVVNTGSITLTQTGSFGEIVTTTDANIGHDLYVSNDIIGNGDLDILGYITASLQPGYLIVGNAAGRTISVPTSSITTNINVSTLATTGSNSFVGNQTITGNVTATSFIGDGSQLTNLNIDDGLPNNNWDFNIEDTTPINDFQTASVVYLIDFNNLPLVGSEAGKIGWFGNTTGATQLLPTTNGLYIIAGDTQVAYVTSEGYSGSIVGIGNVANFSASIDNRFNSIGASALPTGVISGSAQITALGFVSSSSGTSIPNGTVSGSSQLTASFDVRYALSASYLTSLNGALSSSIQVLGGSGIYSSSAQLPNGLISGSSQLTASYDNRYTLSGSVQPLPSGVVSGSSQVINILTSLNAATSSYLTSLSGAISSSSQLTSSYDLRYEGVGRGIVSGSSQLTSSFELKGSGIYSSSAQLPSGIISSSIQLTSSFDGRYLQTGSFNTYTSSNDSTNTTQNNRLTSLENKTGSLATTGSNLFNGSQTITGSISISSGSITMVNRPAFRVTGNASTERAAGLTLSGSAVTVDYNEGNHFNTTNGLFTAPIAGLYHVYYNGRVGGTNAAMQVIMYKNAGVALMWETPGNTGVAHFGVSGIVKLAVNDTLRATVAVGSMQFDGNDSFGAAYIG